MMREYKVWRWEKEGRIEWIEWMNREKKCGMKCLDLEKLQEGKRKRLGISSYLDSFPFPTSPSAAAGAPNSSLPFCSITHDRSSSTKPAIWYKIEKWLFPTKLSWISTSSLGWSVNAIQRDDVLEQCYHLFESENIFAKNNSRERGYVSPLSLLPLTCDNTSNPDSHSDIITTIIIILCLWNHFTALP